VKVVGKTGCLPSRVRRRCRDYVCQTEKNNGDSTRQRGERKIVSLTGGEGIERVGAKDRPSGPIKRYRWIERGASRTISEVGKGKREVGYRRYPCCLRGVRKGERQLDLTKKKTRGGEYPDITANGIAGKERSGRTRLPRRRGKRGRRTVWRTGDGGAR